MTDQSAPRYKGHGLTEVEALSEVDEQVFEIRAIRPPSKPVSVPGDPYIAEFGDRRSLHFDHRTIQSSMSVADPLHLEFDYIRVMMGFLLFDPQPNVITMIGLGGGSLVKYCYYKVPSSLITVIEISREVIALRRRFHIPNDDRRLATVHGDGADYVSRHRCRADVLLIDGFDIDGQPPQLCSQTFYDDCFRHLKPGGLLVVNLWEKHRLCVSRLRKSFENEILVVPTEHGDNQAVFARKGLPLVPDHDALWRSHGERHAGFLPQVAARIARQAARRNLMARVGLALIQPILDGSE